MINLAYMMTLIYNNKILDPAIDLYPGQYVTVLNHRVQVEQSLTKHADTDITYRTDRSGMGDVLRIHAVELPYVVVERLNSTFSGSKYTYDVRRTDFMELPLEFVVASQ